MSRRVSGQREASYRAVGQAEMCARCVCVMSQKQLSHRLQQDKINKGKKAKQITLAHMGAAFSTE